MTSHKIQYPCKNPRCNAGSMLRFDEFTHTKIDCPHCKKGFNTVKLKPICNNCQFFNEFSWGKDGVCDLNPPYLQKTDTQSGCEFFEVWQGLAKEKAVQNVFPSDV